VKKLVDDPQGRYRFRVRDCEFSFISNSTTPYTLSELRTAKTPITVNHLMVWSAIVTTGTFGSRPISPVVDWNSTSIPKRPRADAWAASEMQPGYAGTRGVRAAENLRKHNVSSMRLPPCSAISSKPPHLTQTTPRARIDISRLGRRNRGRLLMVAHVERREHVRIISARELTRSEKRTYEETQK
jgi:uncharacterized DUF497 family protein